MIKATILSTLALSSTLAYSAQNAKNQPVHVSGENSISEAKFNSMHCEPRRMKVHLFHYSFYKEYKGTYDIEPNKCYAAPDFTSVRLSIPDDKGVAFKACRDNNCSDNCYIFRNPGIQIDDIWWYVNKGYSKSFSWVSPHSNSMNLNE
ncbi:hypothetical protein AX774_g5422 [Zancudomyces culisetae]|uniref:Uncharacterized protein n=1 Tax=Zancudomyces culisetae TaxID=1213189 RepID=A0A1R1PJH8_ZANCU|nr:hypothetical protein AX774_g5820 [Zancudomyces culisetae]OMH81134.1 hypothetical protein AX774_g5422 [Zancudomyces culisetae]|eukprot:OMH80740.1 hypothetical protein AX774_g5820 [Zancudomyces culisetae]